MVSGRAGWSRFEGTVSDTVHACSVVWHPRSFSAILPTPRSVPGLLLLVMLGVPLALRIAGMGWGVKPDWRYLIGFLYLPSLQIALLGA